MYRITGGSTHNLPDVEEFLDTLNTLDNNRTPEARRLFDSGRQLVVSRAPGRLDVMGGIADYSGSLVLQWPLQEAALVALQRDPARTIRIVSLRHTGATSKDPSQIAFEMPLSQFEDEGRPIDYAIARKRFQTDPQRRWAAYAAGAFLVLMRERGLRFDDGARILISSRVPEGRGVSSSAALEVATMQAIVAAFDISLEPRELAVLCQKVENLVVGAPCGVMDQMTAACGETGHLLALLCQPAKLVGQVVVPDELEVWGIDSGLSHTVAGNDYASVRVAAFMGYRLLASIAGLSVANIRGGLVQVEDSRWHGYLANVSPSEFEQYYAAQLPEEMPGHQFLERYHGTTDSVTSVEPTRGYRVRVATAHPIYEHFRVRAFASLLSAPPVERVFELLGELMYQSHASYSACGLGAEGTDLLVELVRASGTREGLYGAKITGGGCGGTVAVLGRRGSPALERIAAEYQRKTGRTTTTFSGSSASATAFGYLRLEPEH